MTSVNMRDEDGRTVLHHSTEDVSEYILAGADVNIQDDGGWTPLMCACSGGHIEKAKSLLKAQNIDVNVRNEAGMTALHYAASKGRDELLSVLLQRDDVRLDVQDPNARLTPLMRAVLGHHTPCVRKLIQAGVRLNLQDCEGNTALHIAVREHRDDIALILLEAGAEPEIKNNAGEVALQGASAHLLYSAGLMD